MFETVLREEVLHDRHWINVPMVRLGAIGKLVVFYVAACEVLLGSIGWQFLLLVFAGLVFAVLFFGCFEAADLDG